MSATSSTKRRRPSSSSPVARSGSGTGGRAKPGSGRKGPTARQQALGLSPHPSAAGWAVSGGVFLLAVADLPNLTGSALAPQVAVLLVLGASGLPLLVARAIGRPGARRSWSETWAARCAAGFVVIGAVSVVVNPQSAVALTGLYIQPTGWFFMAALAGVWALVTGLGPSERRLLGSAIIAAAAVNASVAILQVLFGLQALGIPSYAEQPTGFLGNPVFLGAMLAGALPLVGSRFLVEPDRYWPLAALLGVGLGMDGERLPALLALVVMGWMAVQAWRARTPSGAEARPDADPDAGRTGWVRTLYLIGLVVGSMVLGSVATSLRRSGGVLAHTASSTATETFGDRIAVWHLGLRATASHPLLGSGPGRFRAATSGLYSESLTRDVHSGYFQDAHNFVIEYATTIGLIGVAVLIAWIAFSLTHRRGPMVGVALVLLASGLAEPLNITITPLAFIALGASALAVTPDPAAPPDVFGLPPTDTTAGGPRRALRWAALAMAVVVAVPAVLYVIGDISYRRADTLNSAGNPTAALADASRAETLQPLWPQPASLLGAINLQLYTQGDASRYPAAVHWATVAVDRDPTDPQQAALQADLELAGGNLDAAERSARAALPHGEWYPSITATLGVIAASRHQTTEAEMWLERSLAVAPDQPYEQGVLSNLRRGCLPSPITSAQPSLQFNC